MGLLMGVCKNFIYDSEGNAFNLKETSNLFKVGWNRIQVYFSKYDCKTFREIADKIIEMEILKAPKKYLNPFDGKKYTDKEASELLLIGDNTFAGRRKKFKGNDDLIWYEGRIDDDALAKYGKERIRHGQKKPTKKVDKPISRGFNKSRFCIKNNIVCIYYNDCLDIRVIKNSHSERYEDDNSCFKNG